MAAPACSGVEPIGLAGAPTALSRVRPCSTSGGAAAWIEVHGLRACRWCSFRTGGPAPVVGPAAGWAAGAGRRTCCRAASAPPRGECPPLRECRQWPGKTQKSGAVHRRCPKGVSTAGGSPAPACVPAQVPRSGTPVRRAGRAVFHIVTREARRDSAVENKGRPGKVAKNVCMGTSGVGATLGMAAVPTSPCTVTTPSPRFLET